MAKGGASHALRFALALLLVLGTIHIKYDWKSIVVDPQRPDIGEEVANGQVVGQLRKGEAVEDSAVATDPPVAAKPDVGAPMESEPSAPEEKSTPPSPAPEYLRPKPPEDELANFKLTLKGEISAKRSKKDGVKNNNVLVYKVAVPVVSVRIAPCPLGVFAKENPFKKCTKSLSDYFEGKLVVGVKTIIQYGLWLKMRPNPNGIGWVYAPISRKGNGDGYYNLMTLHERLPWDQTIRDTIDKPFADCLLYPNEEIDPAVCVRNVELKKSFLKLLVRLKYISTKEYAKVYAATKKLQLQLGTQKFVGTNLPLLPVDVPLLPIGDSISEKVAALHSGVPIFEGTASEVAKGQSYCRLAKKWTFCVKRKHCVWRAGSCIFTPIQPQDKYNREWIDPKFEWSSSHAHGEKFFVYQPSGGLNNQRIQLEHALIVCRITNRTCVIPHATKHKNKWPHYNEQKVNDVASMQEIFDFELISRIARAVTIPLKYTMVEWVEEMKRQKYSFEVVDRDFKRVKDPSHFHQYNEADIKTIYADDRNIAARDILYFSKASMWHSFKWKGGKKYDHKMAVHNHVSYRNELKAVAIHMATSANNYTAVHVRRGDYKSLDLYKENHKEPEWYADQLESVRSSSNKLLYVASDETYRPYFSLLRRVGWELVFIESLPGDVVVPILERFPITMYDTITGIIDQLLCTYAFRFLGSTFSTFTWFILRMRELRPFIAADTRLPGELGLPPNCRNVTLPCKYYWLPNLHTEPC